MAIDPAEAADRVAAFMMETAPNKPRDAEDPAGGFYEVHGRHVFDSHSVDGYGHVAAADLAALVVHAQNS